MKEKYFKVCFSVFAVLIGLIFPSNGLSESLSASASSNGDTVWDIEFLFLDSPGPVPATIQAQAIPGAGSGIAGCKAKWPGGSYTLYRDAIGGYWENREDYPWQPGDDTWIMVEADATGGWLPEPLPNGTKTWSFANITLNVGPPPPPKVLSVFANPDPWDGKGSMTFTARTDKSAAVEFKIRAPSGMVYVLGSAQTDPSFTAVWTWNGILPGESEPKPGNYTVIAQVGASSKEGNFEIVLPSIIVESVLPIPNFLLVDPSGAGSGIVFKATTNVPATVNFKIVGPQDELVLGSDETELKNSTNVAMKSWWGTGKGTASGSYLVYAWVNSSEKSAPFTVTLVKDYATGMGTWVTKKDISAVVPHSPEPIKCPLESWDRIAGSKDGYFANLAIGEPVNIVFGNYISPEIDLTVKSRFPLTLARIYNSLDPHIGPFGRGWSSPYFSRLEFLASDVMFINSDGGRSFFKNQGDVYLGPPESELKLSLATDTNFWILSHPNGSTWTFNEDGKILRMAESCCGRGVGDSIVFDYDPDGNLLKVTNPAGQWLEFTHNGDGLITKVTDFSGRFLS